LVKRKKQNIGNAISVIAIEDESVELSLVKYAPPRHLCHPELVSGSIILPMNKSYYVYILTNSQNTTIYIGVTNNLIRRIYQHKKEMLDGFTKKYKLKKLIYFEEYFTPKEAITREKQLKNWHRQWKINLIKSQNPKLEDLYDQILK
jgi:putative endonuclease